MSLRLKQPHGRHFDASFGQTGDPGQEKAHLGICLGLEAQGADGIDAALASRRAGRSLTGSTGRVRVTLLMKRKILESNC